MENFILHRSGKLLNPALDTRVCVCVCYLKYDHINITKVFYIVQINIL